MPAKGQKKSLAERFWPKVDKRGPDECWPWLGYLVRGYGQTGDGSKRIYAHRAAMILAGRDPGQLDALHKCNNPRCVNPAHLYAGTHQQNMHDSIDVGSFHFNPSPHGDASRFHKLTERDVPQIRRWHELGLSQNELAAAFGVARRTIRMCILRRTWSTVP